MPHGFNLDCFAEEQWPKTGTHPNGIRPKHDSATPKKAETSDGSTTVPTGTNRPLHRQGFLIPSPLVLQNVSADTASKFGAGLMKFGASLFRIRSPKHTAGG